MPANAVPALLSKADVCNRLAVAPRTLETMVRSGRFPPPVRLGRHVYWSERAISGWVQQSFHAQEAWQPRRAAEAGRVPRK